MCSQLAPEGNPLGLPANQSWACRPHHKPLAMLPLGRIPRLLERSPRLWPSCLALSTDSCENNSTTRLRQLKRRCGRKIHAKWGRWNQGCSAAEASKSPSNALKGNCSQMGIQPNNYLGFLLLKVECASTHFFRFHAVLAPKTSASHRPLQAGKLRYWSQSNTNASS
jgi:hypothetical protein